MIPISEILNPKCATVKRPIGPPTEIESDDEEVLSFSNRTLCQLKNFIDTIPETELPNYYMAVSDMDEYEVAIYKTISKARKEYVAELEQYNQELTLYEEAQKELRKAEVRRKEFLKKCRQIFNKNEIENLERKINILVSQFGETPGFIEKANELQNYRNRHTELSVIKNRLLNDVPSLREVLNILAKE
jgi:hypothetical protein